MFTWKVTDPIVSSPPMLRTSVRSSPIAVSTKPGMRKSQRGLNNNRNRRCLHPSCQVRRCGARLRPSGDSVVGTSLILSFASEAAHDHLARELHAGGLEVEAADRRRG